MFDEIRWAISRPPLREFPRQASISTETKSLINTRIEARRRKEERISQVLRRAIKAGHQGDRQKQKSKAGSAVESLLAFDPPLIREAWIWMQGWYKATVNRPPTPAIVALATMKAEREELYQHVPLTGEPIPVGYIPL